MGQTSEAAEQSGPPLAGAAAPAPAGGPASSSTGRESPSRLRTYLTWSWVVTIVGFTLFRFVIAKGTLETYGLNIWVFGAIDLLTAVPYAVGVAKVVGAIVDRDLSAVTWWAAIAAGSFLAPYLYIAWAGRTATFPIAVYVALGVLIVGFGGNALLGIRRNVRRARADLATTPEA